MELFPMQLALRSDSAATKVSNRTFRRSPQMMLQFFRSGIDPYACEHKSLTKALMGHFPQHDNWLIFSVQKWNRNLRSQLLCAFANWRKVTISVVISIYLSIFLSVWPSARKNSAPYGWIFIKCDIRALLENISIKFKLIQIWQE